MGSRYIIIMYRSRNVLKVKYIFLHILRRCSMLRWGLAIPTRDRLRPSWTAGPAASPKKKYISKAYALLIFTFSRAVLARFISPGFSNLDSKNGAKECIV